MAAGVTPNNLKSLKSLIAGPPQRAPRSNCSCNDIPGYPWLQVRLARRLALEWQAYIVRTHALRKVFASVKGFYYQVSTAECSGQSPEPCAALRHGTPPLLHIVSRET